MRIDDDQMRRAMACAIAGDSAAYRFVLDQSRTWLASYFGRRIAQPMIDDLIQETLVSLHAKRATFDSARPFLPWLAAIARYRWIDALRRMRNEVELDAETMGVESDEDMILARLGLGRLMASLPVAQSNAITLTRIEGKSIAEAAAICGQSKALIKVNVHRGLKKLAAMVESE